jgi:hypothetical protein
VDQIYYGNQLPKLPKINIAESQESSQHSSHDHNPRPVAAPAGAPSVGGHTLPLRQDSQSALKHTQYAQEHQDRNTTRNNEKAASTLFKKHGHGEPGLKARGSSDILRSTKAPSDVVQTTSPHEKRQPSVQDYPPPSRQPSSPFNANEGSGVLGFNRERSSVQNSTVTPVRSLTIEFHIHPQSVLILSR